MIATLYESTESSFTSNGLGSLPDAISGVVHEVLNGVYELTIVYPVTGLHASDLAVNRLIRARVNDNSLYQQVFRIYKIQKSVNNQRITVYAKHISYDMTGYPVRAFTAAPDMSNIISGLNDNCMISHSFIFTTDITGTESVSFAPMKSLRACLLGDENSIVSVYGCEFVFNNKIVSITSRRGADNGVKIRYGKNLESFVSVKTTESAYNGSVAYWSKDNVDVVGDIQRVTGANFPTDKIMILDATNDFDSQPRTEDLNTYAQTYNTDNNIGQVGIETVTVSFVPLWQTEEYKDVALIEQVAMGDTVHVYYDGTTYDLRMVEYEYDYVKERYISTTLGAKKRTLYEAIKRVR